MTAIWRSHLVALGAAIAAILLLFASDATAIGNQWWNSSTYEHCLLILPLVLWLIWQRREEVLQVEPRAWVPALIGVALAALLWLLGDAAGISLVRHAALIAMIQASVLTILGPAAFRALLFPIFYLVFLIPFGDELVPAMQTLTAKMTMGLLHLAGLRATLDGVFITTNAGWFEVAEACAGVKFLVAMVAYATLVAHVCFKSWRRRALFMAFAVTAPVLANGARAFGTIYAAHLTSLEAATGLDHIIYGWIFFALVIAIVMAVAWPFFDRRIDTPWLSSIPQAYGASRSAALLAALVAVVAATPLVWSATVIASGRQALPNTISLPKVPGWTPIAISNDGWRPRFDGADHRLFGRYRDARGRVVDLGIALYGWQGEGRQIVGYAQGAIDPATSWGWSANVSAPSGGKAVRLIGPFKMAREAVTFHAIGGGLTGDALTVKLWALRAKLFGGDQGAATIIVSAPEPAARASIDAFLSALGPVEARIANLFVTARGQ